jgi:hypothetical protein
LSAISKSKILNHSNLLDNFSDHFLFTIIIDQAFKLSKDFSKDSALKAKIISTFLVKNFDQSSLIETSKKFTQPFILDSYSISEIKSYPSSAKSPATISTVEFTQAHAGPVILIFKCIFLFLLKLTSLSI